jgi:hypothetical protein
MQDSVLMKDSEEKGDSREHKKTYCTEVGLGSMDTTRSSPVPNESNRGQQVKAK